MNPVSAAVIPAIGFTFLKIADSLGRKNDLVSPADNQKPANENRASSNSRNAAS